MKTYDRNRNAITIGSYAMVADSGTTGVIKNIDGQGKLEDQIRRSNCVSIEGLDGIFCSLELIRLKFS